MFADLLGSLLFIFLQCVCFTCLNMYMSSGVCSSEQSCYHKVRKSKVTEARQDRVMLREREYRPPLSSDSRTKEIYGGDSKATFNAILLLFLPSKIANNIKFIQRKHKDFFLIWKINRFYDCAMQFLNLYQTLKTADQFIIHFISQGRKRTVESSVRCLRNTAAYNQWTRPTRIHTCTLIYETHALIRERSVIPRSVQSSEKVKGVSGEGRWRGWKCWCVLPVEHIHESSLTSPAIARGDRMKKERHIADFLL